MERLGENDSPDIMNICVNMIVKDEEGRIERCLRSVAPHVQSFVICDTGSTDKTKDVIAKVLTDCKVNFQIADTTFKTWDQARNDALDMARRLEPTCDYFMLMDADMELQMNPGFIFENLTHEAYYVTQKAGPTAYRNIRLVRRTAKAAYHGVTHEYLGVEGNVGGLEAIWFIDHADGANRKDKFDRDINLLREGVFSGLSARYMFYLAQSYKDKGQHDEALKWYSLRSEAGGWHEEAWYARYMAGNSAKALGKIPEFLNWELQACATNPDRAEGWTTLASFFRERGWHELSVMFADRALKCKASGAGLFVNRDMHRSIPLMEVATSGFYVNDEKVRASEAAFRLLVEPEVPGYIAFKARENTLFYLSGIEQFQGARFQIKGFGVADAIFGENNPSIAKHPDWGYEMTLRSVNYEWPSSGPFQAKILDGGNKFISRNYYIRMTDDLDVSLIVPMDFDNLRPPYESLVHGMEDLRLFRWRERLFAMGMSAEYSPNDVRRQVLIELNHVGQPIKVTPIEYSPPGMCEKNWMPVVYDGELLVIYKCHPFTILKIDPDTGAVSEFKKSGNDLDFKSWKGGSQAIPHDNGWVFVIHESVNYSDRPRVYWHRLVYMDNRFKITKFTNPFFLTKIGVEYCAGLSEHRGELVLSFGVDDRRAGFCMIPKKSLDDHWVPVEGG
jgi:glycosyltransferase involved in cell wall biosynthesis